jgi:hypothetical protein
MGLVGTLEHVIPVNDGISSHGLGIVVKKCVWYKRRKKKQETRNCNGIQYMHM